MKVIVLIHTTPGALFEGTKIETDVIDLGDLSPYTFLNANGYKPVRNDPSRCAKRGSHSGQCTIAIIKDVVSPEEARSLEEAFS